MGQNWRARKTQILEVKFLALKQRKVWLWMALDGPGVALDGSCMHLQVNCTFQRGL